MTSQPRVTDHRRVAVIIPAYQEERLLPVTLAGIPAWVDEIIVVDDASTDRTREVALEFARSRATERAEAREAADQRGATRYDTRVRVLTLDENQGVGRAIVVGYLEAWSAEMDVAIVMGADAQMDPRELTSLVEGLEGVAYVKGNRMSHAEVKSRMPRARYLGNLILSKMTGWLTQSPSLSDAQCGYTALDLKWLPRLSIAHLYPRYGFPNDVLMRLHEAQASVRQVDVTPIYGDERSKLSIPKVIIPLLGVLLRGLGRRLLKLINTEIDHVTEPHDVRGEKLSQPRQTPESGEVTSERG